MTPGSRLGSAWRVESKIYKSFKRVRYFCFPDRILNNILLKCIKYKMYFFILGIQEFNCVIIFFTEADTEKHGYLLTAEVNFKCCAVGISHTSHFHKVVKQPLSGNKKVRFQSSW